MLTGRGVAEHFPSERSRVRAFSFWTQPCQGKSRPDDACHGITVTLAVTARNIVTQLVPNIVTQSDCICYISCTSIYATTTLHVPSATTQRHTHRRNQPIAAINPSPRSTIGVIIALGVRNKGKLANETRRDQQDIDEENGDEEAGGEDDSE